jgi:hypothetical protein
MLNNFGTRYAQRPRGSRPSLAVARAYCWRCRPRSRSSSRWPRGAKTLMPAGQSSWRRVFYIRGFFYIRDVPGFALRRSVDTGLRGRFGPPRWQGAP